MTQYFSNFLDQHINQPCESYVDFLSQKIQEKYPNALCIIFYGSCLRKKNIEKLDDELFDFYVVVDSYLETYSRKKMAFFNYLLPPNVFFISVPWQNHMLKAKYAVINYDQFYRGVSPKAWQPALWARFSQPIRLIYTKNDKARIQIINALKLASQTIIHQAIQLVGSNFTIKKLWVSIFSKTYGAELRPEKSNKAVDLYMSNQTYYQHLTPMILKDLGYKWSEETTDNEIIYRLKEIKFSPYHIYGQSLLWFLRSIWARILNFLRLMKASFTFDNGVDYVLWKIKRHSGITMTLTPWQKKHPLLASPVILWKLYKQRIL
ncbi:MAG: hypothetical protein K1X44_03970 [Alphaproteobacteria bacterium]|nr:hypothetical protein [Alphaproteobacteria bacterium]